MATGGWTFSPRKLGFKISHVDPDPHLFRIRIQRYKMKRNQCLTNKLFSVGNYIFKSEHKKVQILKLIFIWTLEIVDFIDLDCSAFIKFCGSGSAYNQYGSISLEESVRENIKM